MPAYLYLSDEEMKEYTEVDDRDINYAFQEVRKIPNGHRFLIQDHIKERKTWYGKKWLEITYTLYYGEGPEVQNINFFVEYSATPGLNFNVDKTTMLAFLTGILSGYNIPLK